MLTACGAPDSADRIAGPVDTLPPAVLPVLRGQVHATQGAVVGQPFTYDATLDGEAFVDQSGTGLQYEVSFAPHPNGLSAQRGVITGSPVVPMPMALSIKARDGKGGSAHAIFTLIAFDSTLNAPVSGGVPTAYDDMPAHVRSQGAMLISDNAPPGETPNASAVHLGRVLFYDRRLSVNDKVSCSSCHIQEFGFSDTAQFSRGFTGGSPRRHTMSLVNTRFYRPNRFFWDERAASLEELVLLPIQDPIEMGLSAGYVVPKLESAGFYAPLFRQAFGSSDITLQRVSSALAQFVRSLMSYRSPFDEPLIATGDPRASGYLSTEQLRGLDVFQQHCFVCHTSVGQVAMVARNNGLDAVQSDQGAGEGRFKVPSLRNIAVTAPYMHDGRFRTIEEVIEFYDSQVKASPNLDSFLKNSDGSVARLNLSVADKAALAAFLRSLTDRHFLEDPRFSDPFPRR
jgi:cytochrome c peroxidase